MICSWFVFLLFVIVIGQHYERKLICIANNFHFYCFCISEIKKKKIHTHNICSRYIVIDVWNIIDSWRYTLLLWFSVVLLFETLMQSRGNWTISATGRVHKPGWSNIKNELWIRDRILTSCIIGLSWLAPDQLKKRYLYTDTMHITQSSSVIFHRTSLSTPVPYPLLIRNYRWRSYWPSNAI